LKRIEEEKKNPAGAAKGKAPPAPAKKRNPLVKENLRSLPLMCQNLRYLRSRSGRHRLITNIWLRDLWMRLQEKSWKLAILNLRRLRLKNHLRARPHLLLSSHLHLNWMKMVSLLSMHHLLQSSKRTTILLKQQNFPLKTLKAYRVFTRI